MKNTTFTGSSLEEALTNDSFTQSGVELVGMVKPSEKNGYVCFTRSGCDNWVDLPIDMIEEAEQIGKNTCKDHSHIVMKIILKEPESPEARIFSALSSNSAPSQVEPRLSEAVRDFMTPQSHRIQQGAEPRVSSFPPSQTIASFRRDFGQNAPLQPWLNGGAGGLFDGGFGSFGCWDSTCTRCIRWKRVSNGTATWSVCEQWEEYPCERCVWPW